MNQIKDKEFRNQSILFESDDVVTGCEFYGCRIRWEPGVSFFNNLFNGCEVLPTVGFGYGGGAAQEGGEA